MIEANGVVCTEPFGVASDPPILLVVGRCSGGRRASVGFWRPAAGSSFATTTATQDTRSPIGPNRRRTRAPTSPRAAREFVRRDVERAHAFAATRNHARIPDDERSRGRLSSIAVATLVIHGTADPMFPLEHGEALVDEIPVAKLLRLEGAGHGVQPADWKTIAGAILEHTSAQTADPPGSRVEDQR
jgi:pimeloyl-ACP methyl ester carboxylesterase